MSHLPVPYEPRNAAQNKPQPEPRRDLPLGTAAWHQFSSHDIPHFKPGQFFLSYLSGGDAIGIDDDGHVLICGGTRGGKGTCFLIPNLCAWQGSVFVIDPKGENAMVTARRRGNGSAYCEGLGQKVYLLDPFRTAATEADDLEELQACYNPLDLLRADRPEAIEDAARIAEATIPADKATDPFWPNSAGGMHSAFSLHVATSSDFLDEERHLVTVRHLMKVGHDDIKRVLEADGETLPLSGLDILFSHMKRNTAFKGLVAEAGERFARMAKHTPRMFESILQTALTATDYMDSTAIERCLSRSDFALSDLKTDPNGVSLFLSLPQRFMSTHAGYLRMMTSLVTAEMERVPGKPKAGHAVLMVLDEFAGLGRMRSVETAVAQIAGFGVKMVFAVQTLAQLKHTYQENWETFVANCRTKLFFNNYDYFTCEYVSKVIGDCEALRTTHSQGNGTSRSDNFSSGFTTGVSSSTTFGGSGGAASTTFGSSSGHTTSHAQSFGENWSKGETDAAHKRALIDPAEITRVFGNPDAPAALLLIGGRQPLALRRRPYFTEFMWAGMYGPHRDHPLPMRLVEVRKKRTTDRLAVEASARARQAAIDAAMEGKRLRDAEAAREKAAKAHRRRIVRWTMGLVVYWASVLCVCEVIRPGFLAPRAILASLGYGLRPEPSPVQEAMETPARVFSAEFQHAVESLRRARMTTTETPGKQTRRIASQSATKGVFAKLFADK